MKTLTGPEVAVFVDQIVDATKVGRVTDWVERISEIAKLANLPLAEILWNEAPHNVAFAMVDLANSRGYAEQLEAGFAEYKARNH